MTLAALHLSQGLYNHIKQAKLQRFSIKVKKWSSLTMTGNGGFAHFAWTAIIEHITGNMWRTRQRNVVMRFSEYGSNHKEETKGKDIGRQAGQLRTSSSKCSEAPQCTSSLSENPRKVRHSATHETPRKEDKFQLLPTAAADALSSFFLLFLLPLELLVL